MPGAVSIAFKVGRILFECRDLEHKKREMLYSRIERNIRVMFCLLLVMCILSLAVSVKDLTRDLPTCMGSAQLGKVNIPTVSIKTCLCKETIEKLFGPGASITSALKWTDWTNSELGYDMTVMYLNIKGVEIQAYLYSCLVLISS